MSKRDFFHSTPNDIEIFIDEFDKRYRTELEVQSKHLEYGAWLNGLYVRMAVASTLSKKAKYPKEPFGDKQKQESITVTEDMSEEEKEKARQEFAKNMMELFVTPNADKEDED